MNVRSFRRLITVALLTALSGCASNAEPPKPTPEVQMGFDLIEANQYCTRFKAELATSRGSPDEPLLTAQVQRWCGKKVELLRALQKNGIRLLPSVSDAIRQ